MDGAPNDLHTSLRDLLHEAYNQGGPTPVADAFSRWADIWPWQARRPIERAWAHRIERALSGDEAK